MSASARDIADEVALAIADSMDEGTRWLVWDDASGCPTGLGQRMGRAALLKACAGLEGLILREEVNA